MKPVDGIKNLPILYVCLLAFCAVFAKPATAQYTLRIVVTNEAVTHLSDPLYAAGNFNSWNPGNPAYQLQKENNKHVLAIKDVPAGIYEFKFSRGSWGKVASAKSGADLGNNVLQLSGDTTV